MASKSEDLALTWPATHFLFPPLPLQYLPFGPGCGTILLGPQTLVYLSAASCYACDTRRKLRAKFNLPVRGAAGKRPFFDLKP